ncbi:MAG: hypothetical protein ACD_45C00244G0002 [uncultured bacterium]|nr:MAG: hypothetical protein ACD_45C00244G0002 [uncultured bacterium]OGT58038.1 MAG: hypothetical protein A3F43_06200 [Gammaproteobacteria bacterium RIFCSPHIGHO2_12_FULL_42_10]
MQTETIIYEQPLNEIVRVCLRLEQLFQALDHKLNDETKLGTHHVIRLIIDILQILERPDLKAKFSKELNSCLTSLMRYGSLPQIDAKKLETLTQQLEELSRHLIDSNEKIGHHLRDTCLLNALRLHLSTPGGGCSFDTPLYHYWLQQPFATRRAIITDWLKSFTQIQAGVALLLDIVRNHTKTEEKTAPHGFHQELLDPQTNLRMIRISIHAEIHAFPQISVGRHFLSVRFFSPNIIEQPHQYADDLFFWLTYCY